MAIVLNRSTQILIDNFVSTFFSNIPSENKAKIKESVVEIADSILEQNDTNLKDSLNKLVTKGDLRDEVTPIKDEIKALKDDMIVIKSSILTMQDSFKKEITESKFELLKWLVMTQIAMVGILIATKLI